MNFKRFKKYIVVGENNQPMTFDKNQFCYCDTHHARRPHAVQLYSEKKAKELIRKTVEYRTKNNVSIGEYNLMPVNPKSK